MTKEQMYAQMMAQRMIQKRSDFMRSMAFIDPWTFVGQQLPAPAVPVAPAKLPLQVAAPPVTSPLEALLLTLKNARDVAFERAGKAVFITFTWDGIRYQLELTQPEHLNASNLIGA